MVLEKLQAILGTKKEHILWVRCLYELDGGQDKSGTIMKFPFNAKPSFYIRCYP
jgi:hypothetical protein